MCHNPGLLVECKLCHLHICITAPLAEDDHQTVILRSSGCIRLEDYLAWFNLGIPFLCATCSQKPEVELLIPVRSGCLYGSF
jgi:hypothetical protein